jgi:uncharacterized protein YraI
MSPERCPMRTDQPTCRQGRNRNRRVGHRRARFGSGVLVLLLWAVLVATSQPALAAPAGAVVQGDVSAAITPAGADRIVAVVRSGGGTLLDAPQGQTVQSLAVGTALYATGRSADGRWLFAAANDGTAGWIEADQVVAFHVDGLPVLTETDVTASATAASLVAEDTDATSAPVITATVRTQGERLNVRAGPGLDYAVVARAQPGEILIALAQDATSVWIQVELPGPAGGFGWVSARYVALDGTMADLPLSQRTSSASPLPAAAVPSPATVTGLQGHLVFQASSGGTIYVYDLASSDLRALTDGSDPAISPDGSTVAFVRGGGESGLYLIDLDGANERRIFSGGEQLRSPTWSPDGKWIAFSRVTGADSCRDVGFGICFPDGNPFLAPFPLAYQDLRGVSRVDINGENFRDLPTLQTASSPDWQANGIVYQSDAGLQITADTPDADNRSVLGDFLYRDPNWQPGGDRITFQKGEGSHWEIFAVNPDGSGLVALTRPSSGLLPVFPHNVASEWSPDGQSIVFLSNRSDTWALWVMAADGTNQRRLSIDVSIEYGFQNEQVVSWGP